MANSPVVRRADCREVAEVEVDRVLLSFSSRGKSKPIDNPVPMRLAMGSGASSIREPDHQSGGGVVVSGPW